jgi:hypothetical protein
MDDCARVNHATLQWLTCCLTPWTIDRAVGDMQADSVAGPQLATYVRYNVLLDRKWLGSEIEAEYSSDQLTRISAMDDPSNMEQLAEIGHRAAERQVKPQHFAAAFDLA